MAFSNQLVTVGTTPAAICTLTGRGGVLIQNQGSAAVFIGGAAVAASGANTGISIAAGAMVLVPSVGTNPEVLYGVVAAATQPVVFLFPSD